MNFVWDMEKYRYTACKEIFIMNSFQIGAKRSAFTLIELLVVIAIIAILASILFPVFGRARENARRSSCQSNLKQIGLGIMQYTQDYDEKYPGRVWGNAINNDFREAYSWRRTTFPYIKSTQVFSCPSNVRVADNIWPFDSDATRMTNVGLNPNSDPRFKISYAINATGNVGGITPSEYAGGNSLSAIEDSAGTILVAEYNDGAAHLGMMDPQSRNWADGVGTAFKGHLGMCNFVFADGHVKAMKPAATGTPTNMWTGQSNDVSSAGLLGELNEWQTLVNNS
jgi:prepilin-type N-terminal cleavage/methylation domain-containing protein/prepilin-type processing-associated H-X9-DG protein